MKNELASVFRRFTWRPHLFGVVILAASLGAASLGAAPQCTGEEPEKDPTQATPVKATPAKAIGNLFDGKTLAGWRVIEAFAYKDHGEVVVEKGEIKVGAGQPASGIAWKGAPPPRSNYEFSLEAKRTDGGDFFCGVTFPVDESYCTFIVGGWGGGVIGLSNLDGQSAIENETTAYLEFKDDHWYRVRIRVTEKKIEAWIDDEQQVDLDREDRKFSIWWEQEPVRPLGIATWNTAAAFRKLTLRRVKPAEKKPSAK